MEFLKVKSLHEAYELIDENFGGFSPETERVSLEMALGRICAGSFFSDCDIPGFDRSTVDGYAVISRDTFGASETVPSMLNIVGAVEMGFEADIEIQAGEAVYVPTGGALPKGADSVVMIEDTDIMGESLLCVYSAAAPGSNIIYRGEDVKKGAAVINAGKEINPLDTGALAAAGICELEVYKPLRFFIISTGDEITEITAPPENGKIRDINGHVLSAMLKRSGQEVTKRVIVRDDFDALRAAVSEGLSSSDAVIVSGGSSAGKKDYTAAVMNSFNDIGVLMHGLSVKPGKPTILGRAMNKPIFGLPGHPAAAAIVFELLVARYINMAQKRIKRDTVIRAKMGFNVHSSPGKTTCQTVCLKETDGELTAFPTYGKSGLITLLSGSDGYIKIPEHIEGIDKGSYADIWLL